jgi:two-component system, OmpR family, sensor kinase
MTITDATHATLLETLERLLEAPPADLKVALDAASDALAQALRAEKVDSMLYAPERDSLVAVGSSSQPLTALQKRHGLDALPLANGGRSVAVFTTGEAHVTGRLDQDEEELRGMKEALGVRSLITVPLDVGGQRRGVLTVASTIPDRWGDEDLRFAQAVARWVGVVAHRAELIADITRTAIEQGRRTVAEELVTVLAHDLRNHLSPLTARLQLLRRRAERDQRDKDVHELDQTLRGLGRVAALISDMLDVARIDQGVFRVAVQAVDLVDLVEDVASTLSTAEHPIHLRPYEDVMVAGDPARLRQCLENLLSNAVKHSPRGAAVVLSIERQRQERGELASVEVADEGPGIAPELATRLFDRFVTGAGQEGGLGLGLYLAKRIAVMHGGDLTVDSAPGRGARFLLTVPIFHDG